MRAAALGLVALAACVAAAPASAAPGDLDPSFSGDGKRTKDLYRFDSTAEVLSQDGGKTMVVGDTRTPSDLALMRYGDDGSLDASFSGDGVKISDLGGYEFADAAVMQDDGKIVVAGSKDNDFLIARFLPGGSLDRGFSGNGWQTTDFGGEDHALAVDVGSDGKIVAAGETSNDPGYVATMAVARYNDDGRVDKSFSGTGKQTTSFGAEFDVARGVAIQDDGRVLAAGYTSDSDTGGVYDNDFALVRYDVDGGLDHSFSVDGKQTTDFFDSADYGSAVALQPDGKIVVAGDAYEGSQSQLALARYESDGDIDTTFSGDGKQTTAFPDGANGEFAGLAIDPVGRIVIGGDSRSDLAVARFGPVGTPDSTFAGDGERRVDVGR